MTATEAMDRTTGSEDRATKSEGETTNKARGHHQRVPSAGDAPSAGHAAPESVHKTPKKRRKERPCTRCVKRNIGHLCHDEPREHETKKPKSLPTAATQQQQQQQQPQQQQQQQSKQEPGPQPDPGRSALNQNAGAMRPLSFDGALGNRPGQASKSAFEATTLAGRGGNPLQLVQPTPVSGIAANALGSGMSQFPDFSDAWLAAQNPYHDMHNFHPNYVIAPEVTNEFNLLNDFLQTSLLDDTGLLNDDQAQVAATAAAAAAAATSGFPGTDAAMLPPGAAQGGSLAVPNAEHGKVIPRPNSALPADKARAYYLQAADPSGNAPEERMRQVLQAKYEAGMLKPFNYIKGYTRLQNYLAGHVSASSKQKILRQLDRFRPKFREKIKDLTDMDLVLVEMWFERTLMDYDRVFASMAVPACCWRRTGEIFRGNKEMAELIRVPVEDLRGGKIALHEILTEDSNVRYWEEFGTIAFDSAHDTLLTACSLKNPADGAPAVNCCFSFRIRRDDHKMYWSDLKANKPITEVAGKLRLLLSTPDPSEIPQIEALISEVTPHIDNLYACQQTYRPGISGDLDIDQLGTELWNRCARVGRVQKEKRYMELQPKGLWKEGDQVGSLEELTIYGRALAFHLLAIARPREDGPLDVAAVIRLLKLALKFVGVCVDAKHLTRGGQVLHLAADFNIWLQGVAKDLPEEEAKECQCLEVEYFIMRTTLCMVQKRFDIAEHMYTKSEHLHKFLTPEYAERLGSNLLAISKSLSDLHDNKAALRWLNRALDVVNTQEPGKLSYGGRVLRRSVFQALVAALLIEGGPENLEKARNLMHYIEAENGDGHVVWMLKLELLIKTPAEVFDSEGYADTLRHAMRHFIRSDSGFKLALIYIRKLHDKSPGAGCAVMDDFITLLGSAKNHEWLEKAVVTRMWMITSQRDSLETISTVKSVLKYLNRPLSAEAAGAAQALLWKKLELNYVQGQYDLAESWCQLGLHDTFENCGAENKSKLESLQDATSVLDGLSPQSWRDPMTAYLAFKVAIRVEDRALAEKCLETVAQAPDHVDYLGACIAESQKTGDISCALSALKKLQERYEYKEPNPIHLPALFRCTIRLLNLLVERQGEGDTNAVVGDLCEVFDAVLYSNMRKLVNEIWTLENFDAVKLTKYTRCLFQATLPLNDSLAMDLLDEACTRARELHENPDTPWPEDELEWMATTAFNHAIDCYGARETDQAKAWATKAINLAHYCRDDALRRFQSAQGTFTLN
ncbi:meiosis protein SPO22/ZIP4 like-domain-containing protein [Dichotomopilus funicola]|uniref:Meiosis protein SPO22/ZIP4 like-domain-containing protein n=1 Tax=Dichotomopilus funicola TaxID=1934379 RepID=A0AAN6UZ61_9PEZI|nr:meiosis protein SPO22/ZIP4 like-domain-containing protein [Dichotomopilus funicola]